MIDADHRGTVRAEAGERGAGLIRAMIGLLVVAVMAVAIFVVVSGNKNNAKDDAKITACTPSPSGGKPQASGQVTNHSSKTSAYVITIRFKDASGNKLSEGIASLKSVDPGASAGWQLTGVRSAKGEVRCSVEKVARAHLPGQ